MTLRSSDIEVPPDVPRAARSLDDLVEGQVVAYHSFVDGDDSAIYTITHVNDDDALAWDVNGTELSARFRREPWRHLPGVNIWDGRIVILQDPEPVPVQIPADLIDALAEVLDKVNLAALDSAARDILDAARNGTDQ